MFFLFSFDIAAIESGVAPQNTAVLAKTIVGKSGKFGKDQLFNLNLSVGAFWGFLFGSLFLVLLLFGVLRSLLLVLIFLRLGLLRLILFGDGLLLEIRKRFTETWLGPLCDLGLGSTGLAEPTSTKFRITRLCTLSMSCWLASS